MEQTAMIVRRNLQNNPAIAGLLSAIVCGLGQVYSGRKGRGIMLFLIFGILIALTTTVWIFGVVDAVRGTGKANPA
jgi:TM2 domain-containing membrane protein YozV